MPLESLLLGVEKCVSAVLPPPVWQGVRHVDRVTAAGVGLLFSREAPGHDEGVDLDIVGVEAKLA